MPQPSHLCLSQTCFRKAARRRHYLGQLLALVLPSSLRTEKGRLMAPYRQLQASQPHRAQHLPAASPAVIY